MGQLCLNNVQLEKSSFTSLDPFLEVAAGRILLWAFKGGKLLDHKVKKKLKNKGHYYFDLKQRLGLFLWFLDFLKILICVIFLKNLTVNEEKYFDIFI